MPKKKEFVLIINENLEIGFDCSDTSNNPRLSGIAKRILSKNSIDLEKYLISLEIPIRLCNICKQSHNMNFDLIFSEKDSKFSIVDISYDTPYNKKSFYCYGQNSKCKGRKLNSNSIEYIKLVLDISEDEAREYIHKHNKSPFYRENHKSDEEYSASQTRNLNYYKKKYGNKRGKEAYDRVIKKMMEGQKLETYQKKYGKKKGTEIYNNICSKKGITFNNLFNKYKDVEKANEVLQKWKASVGRTREDIIDANGLEKGLQILEARRIKTNNTRVINGNIIIPKELRLEYNIYKIIVDEETQLQLLKHGRKKFGDDWRKRKKKEKLHLDHMYSVKSGFLNDIDPFLIGNITNLDLIPASENCVKRHKNSVSLEFLIENIK